jgi:hypothetical protein
VVDASQCRLPHQIAESFPFAQIPTARDFEDICRKVISAEHPGSWSPREDKGDHGIDILVGDSMSAVDVYQVKFFREKVRDSQQAQIRESYDRILEAEHRIRSWTLMLPIELSYEEMRWFEGWKRKQNHNIRLISGPQLEEKLKRPEYREALNVLSGAFSTAGLQIKWSERPAPILKVAFCIGDPYRSEAYKVVHVRVILENVGKRSVRSPKISIEYSEPGIAHLAENPVWKRVHGLRGEYPLNPRVLEADLTIRPGDSLDILPIRYPLSRFREIGIHCKLMMDDESPVQSGVTISPDEVPQAGWKEKLGEENFFPALRPCPTEPDPSQNLSPVARDVLSRIIASPERREGKGMTLIRGYPSNNEATACVFSLGGGNTIWYKPDDIAGALAELIQAKFIIELDRSYTQNRYKLIDK